MKSTSVNLRVAFAAGLGLFFSMSMRGEPPSDATRPSRSKPQVIYHLPRTSTYAATLHSQAKTEGDRFPIDSGAPPNPPPRSAPSEAVPEPRHEMEKHVSEPTRGPSQPQVKHSAGRGKGHGNSRGGGHGHKK